MALFDYSHEMSPNVNAEEEELSFRKHQLIKVSIRNVLSRFADGLETS